VKITAKANGYADLTGTRTFTVTRPPMTGDLTVQATGDGVNADNSLRPASNVTFSVSGVTNPATGVTYEWTVQQNNTTAQTFHPNIPPNQGKTLDFAIPATVTAMDVYKVTVTAKAAGYADRASVEQTFNVKPATFAGSLQIGVTGTAANADGSLRPGSSAAFQATGLTGLPAGVQYAWTWTPPAGSPANSAANPWTNANTGGGEGDGAIAVTVKAGGYADATLQKTVSIRKGVLTGTPAIVAVNSTPAANADGSFRPGSQVQFRVNGLTGLPDGTEYAWTWTPHNGTPANATTAENTWTANIGTAEGAGTVAVTVKANGYADKPANRPVNVQKTAMSGTPAIVPNGITRTIDNMLCFLPASTIQFAASMTSPPEGVTYEWTITNRTNSSQTAGTGSSINYTATLINPNAVIGDLVDVKLTAKAAGYADRETVLPAGIRCFPFGYAEAVPKITYTSGGGSTIYTGASVIFTAPVIGDPNNGANATYTWQATGDGLNNSDAGTGLQWTTSAPATPTAAFGATVTITQPGYCPDARSLPGLSVNCQPPAGVLTANVQGKVSGDIYFNKAQDLLLVANYNGGTAPADSYTWNIGGQYERTTAVNNHTIQSSDAQISALSPGTYTLTVKAVKGACTLQTVSYNIFVVDCPYSGADLLIDATHECKEITTGNTAYYQAYITAGAQNYRIVRLPTTEPSSGYNWWFAENSKLGTSTQVQDGVAYYIQNNATSSACPSGWTIPSSSQWTGLFNATGTSSDGTALCSYGSGTDLWGFSATNTHYYNASNAFQTGEEGAYMWSSTTNGYARIWVGNSPAQATDTGKYILPVRCIHQ
jgi:uncharacterized protein (TIGR02145 family)